MAILQDQNAALRLQLAQLQAENEALKVKAIRGNGHVVVKARPLGGVDAKGEPYKGNVGIYGLGRYPTFLYASQWLKVLTLVDTIRKVCEDGLADGSLASKDTD